MGKPPKMKSREISAKSRAARRGSPTTVADEPSKTTTGDDKITERDLKILAARQGAGISKKQKQKPLSRQQRLRKERGMARADVVVDQLEKKVGESKKRGKRTKERAAAWEDLNGQKRTIPAEKDKQTEKGDMELDDGEEDEAPDPAAALIEWQEEEPEILDADLDAQPGSTENIDVIM